MIGNRDDEINLVKKMLRENGDDPDAIFDLGSIELLMRVKKNLETKMRDVDAKLEKKLANLGLDANRFNGTRGKSSKASR